MLGTSGAAGRGTGAGRCCCAEGAAPVLVGAAAAATGAAARVGARAAAVAGVSPGIRAPVGPPGQRRRQFDCRCGGRFRQQINPDSFLFRLNFAGGFFQRFRHQVARPGNGLFGGVSDIFSGRLIRPAWLSNLILDKKPDRPEPIRFETDS